MNLSGIDWEGYEPPEKYVRAPKSPGLSSVSYEARIEQARALDGDHEPRKGTSAGFSRGKKKPEAPLRAKPGETAYPPFDALVAGPHPLRPPGR